MDSRATLLEVRDLRVRLDGGPPILDHLSFEVRRGDILTILGPNGAGKTVLLRALLGVIPHEGTIAWREGVRIGYVPQRLPYIKDVPMTVDDFFALKRAPASAAREMLAAVGLEEGIGRKRVGDLSSGQFQRVLIAWALVGHPDVLLFDEPTTGVDVGGEHTIYTLLESLHDERELTMLLVTHDLSVVYELSTNVLCINRKPICFGAPLSVLTPDSLQRLYGAPVKYHHHEQA